MTGPMGVALSMLPARFRNRGLVTCMAMMVMSLVRTLLCLMCTPELPRPIPSPWVPLLMVPWTRPASFTRKLLMRTLLLGALIMPMKSCTAALHLPTYCTVTLMLYPWAIPRVRSLLFLLIVRALLLQALLLATC